MPDAPAAPPPWLTQLVQRMDARMEALETRLSTLSLSQTPAATPPPLPEVVSTQAFEALLAQPRLPPESRTFLIPLSKAFSRLSTTLTPEELQEYQDAYTQTRIAVLTPIPSARRPPTPPQTPHRGRAPSRQTPPACYVDQWVTFYRSRSGKIHDTSKPPPYPCRHCGHYHWHLTPCQKNAGPSSASGSSL